MVCFRIHDDKKGIINMKKFMSSLIAFTLVSTMFTGCAAPVSPSTSTAPVDPSPSSDTSTPDVISPTVHQGDIIIVGAGGAGLTAAIEAHDAGAKVILIEKMPFAGGNTIRSKGGLNAAGTVVQEKLGITDDAQTFYNDTFKGGKEMSDPELLKFFTDNSASAVDWLLEIGMDLGSIGHGAGATNARMHRPEGGKSIGATLVKTLTGNVNERSIQMDFNMTATELMTENGVVVGVIAKDKQGNIVEYKGDAVIIAAGGFAANEALFSKYNPDLAGFITTNHAGATGDGIVLAEQVGAGLVHIDQIQTNPTVEQSQFEVISESIRGLGAIFVNQGGVRITNEMGTRDVLSTTILGQPEQYTYILFDQNTRENMAAVESMINLGIVSEGATIQELATTIGTDPVVLKTTLDTWNNAVATKNDAEFGRTTGMDHDLTKAPYYAIKVAPGVHYTMGGVKINTNTEVLTDDDTVIDGLFAAGEVTGGIHGGNRLGGNAVGDIIVMGRQAGTMASTLALANGSLLEDGKAVTSPVVFEIKEGATLALKDGTYQGTSEKGRNGKVVIEITVKDGKATNITTVQSAETEGFYTSVEEEMFKSFIYNQSIELDAVSGATLSSDAVEEAIVDAVNKAK